MNRILIFDFNGVIVNDESLHYETFRDVLMEEGIALDRATYEREYLGMGNDTIAFAKALGRPAAAGQRDSRVAELVERKSARYRARALQALPLVAGVQAFMRAAARRSRVVVVSGAWRSEVEFGLERAGLRPLVEAIVAAEDITVGKPDPEGLRLCLSRIGAPPHRQVVVLEDSRPGISAARALGAGCVAIASSHRREELMEADAVWDSFEGHEPAELEPVWR